ncbi:MAG: XRE family transcriptional regulator, partial [Lactobacillus crispatus]|nr:XRE family transcriptional regulator [Lactobacillus crispatus]
KINLRERSIYTKDLTVSQRRLATVGINYLFNFRKLSKEFNKTVLKIISWIKTTSIVPELGIIRELNAYFLAVYEGNISVSTNIKNVLKISGYQNLANDLPN